MVHINLSEIIKEAKKIDSSNMPLALSRAINRTLSKLKVVSTKAIKSKYKIKSTAIRKSISIKKANRMTETGKIKVEGAPLNLKYFGARQTKKGVSVNITGSRKLIPGVFIKKMPSGYEGVFARGKYGSGGFEFMKPRLPLSSLRGVSIPLGLVKSKQVVAKTVNEFLPKRLAHELSRLNK